VATDVDICNLALSHLGDDATVATLDPPEGSAQATHCARFYPIARAALQDMTNWGFCTTRQSLPLLSATPLSGWSYAYAPPSDAINILAIFPAGASDDFEPQPYDTEQLPDGTSVIYTNAPSAVCRYSRHVTDTSKFPPLFVNALARLLAVYLAGPVLKGDSGRAAAKEHLAIFQREYALATGSDAANRKVQPPHNPTWMANR
jgi:hypothetical protein